MAFIKETESSVLFKWLLMLSLFFSLLAGCNRGEEGAGNAAGENTWDKMVWDQGKWE